MWFFTFIYIANRVVSGEIYTTGQNFTLPPGVTGVTNSTSASLSIFHWEGGRTLDSPTLNTDLRHHDLKCQIVRRPGWTWNYDFLADFTYILLIIRAKWRESTLVVSCRRIILPDLRESTRHIISLETPSPWWIIPPLIFLTHTNCVHAYIIAP